MFKYENIKYIYENNLNLIDLFENIKNDNIERLGIFIIDDIQLKIECQIILENIRIVEIRINRFNSILFKLFEYIQFPNLNEYILNINDYISQNEILKTEESDFNIINKLIFKKEFILKDYFHLPNELKLINNFELNLKHLLYVYKIKRKEKYSFKLNINDDKYYNQIDLLIDEKEIIKYKKIDIKGIKGKIEKIKENINLNDMNEYIQYFKNLSGIYFEEEFQKYNFLNIIEQFNNLKYINLRIGYIEDSNNILFNIIKNSQNLKSLILRLEPNQNINLFLQIIQNLKYLRILNISGININLNEILAQYPKLKNKLYYFKEFKIGNEGFIFNKNNLYYYIKCK